MSLLFAAPYGYLAAILVSLLGIAAYDARNARLLYQGARTYVPIAATMALLLAADVAGIALGIFRTNPDFVSGYYLVTPDLPVEELFLLFFLGYLTLVLRSAFARTS